MNKLYLIDLDRTLLSVPAMDTIIRQACERLGADYGQTQEPRRETEARGESFQELKWIRDNLLAEEDYELFIKLVREIGAEKSPLYPDTDAFLQGMRDKNMQYGIITYGDHDSQLLKIITTGLQTVPYVITADPHKGTLMRSWQYGSGFVVPTSQGVIEAESLVLVDDKAVSFDNLPEDCYGYLVRRTDEPTLRSQQGETPPEVRRVPSLSHVLEGESL